MTQWVLVAVAVAAAVSWLARSARPRTGTSRRAAPADALAGALFPPGLRALDDGTPWRTRTLTAAVRATADFERAYDAALAALDPDPAARVRAMFACRARTQAALGELRMALPNDLVLERQVAALAEDLDRGMLAHIEDARAQLGVPLVHPGPVDDAWYGAWTRAANDLVR
jgi:hypothetical protein